MATSPEEAKKLAEAQRTANEAIKEGSSLTAAFGRLLQSNLKTAKHLHVEADSLQKIIKQQISDKKDELSFADRLANNKKLQKDLSKKIAHEDAMGASAIKEGLGIQLQGLKAQETNLKRLIKIDNVTGGLASKASNFVKALSVAVVLKAAFALAQKFAASIDAIGKQFGSLNVLGEGFKQELLSSQEAVVGIGASLEDVVATTNELSSEFGLSLDEAVDLSAQVIDTARAVGLSNEEAAKLSGILQTTSGLTGNQAERLSEGAFQLAAMNRVNPSAVLRDMAGASEAFASFSEDGGDNLAKAAVQARALGLSLDTTAKIAEGLLDFEQSITKEVEASVLIGRQLNFQKARELALNNDIEGAISSVVSQLGSETEFNELNSIQRKAIADSIGVSVADMAKMVANQNKANILAGETAKSFADIIGKDAMSELTATMNELKIFGVALANTLGPILMGIAKIVNFVLTPIGQAVSGISRTVRGVNDFHTGPGGITTMMGPAGIFSLNPRDSVLATTNPIPVRRMNDGLITNSGGLQVTPNGGGNSMPIQLEMKGEIVGGDTYRHFVTIPNDGTNGDTNILSGRNNGK